MIENNTYPLDETDSDGNFGNMTGECYHEYTGSHCLSVLQSLAICESPERTTPDKVYISNSVINQKAVEEIVDNVLFGLGFYIKPSDECRRAVVPLLCFYSFGLCGTYNVDYRPTAEECREVRDSTCQSEWQEAEKLLELSGRQFQLPDCSSLGDEGLDCDYGNQTINL